MSSVRVRPGEPLSGAVRVAGASKNSGCKQLAAALLAEGTTTVTNVPSVADLEVMLEVLTAMGVGVERVGPESLRHFKRTYREALRRMVASGTFRPDRPVVVPIADDKRFRSWKTEHEPVANAVIVYMMDVSGSMGDEQKEIVRTEAFWIDTWLRSQYKGIETRYIIHDATAREVDEDTFFRTRESGGTKISSAYELCLQLIRDKYPASEWNVYPFHFSDGARRWERPPSRSHGCRHRPAQR